MRRVSVWNVFHALLKSRFTIAGTRRGDVARSRRKRRKLYCIQCILNTLRRIREIADLVNLADLFPLNA